MVWKAMATHILADVVVPPLPDLFLMLMLLADELVSLNEVLGDSSYLCDEYGDGVPWQLMSRMTSLR